MKSISSFGFAGGVVALTVLLFGSLVHGQAIEPKRTLEGHTGIILGMEFSTDGSTLASCGYDKTIRVWDFRTGQCLATLKPPVRTVCQVAFSPDGKYLVSGDFDASVRVWDVATWKEIAKLDGHTGKVSSLVFSPDGKTLISGAFDRTMRVWQWQPGNWDKQGRLFARQPSDVWSLAISPDGKTLASSGRDKTVRLWEVSTGREVALLKGHTEGVLRTGFSLDGQTLITAGGDGTIKTWDVATHRELASTKASSKGLLCLSLSPDGKTLAISGQEGGRSVQLWEFPSLRGPTILNAPENMCAVAISPDGRSVVAGGFDFKIRVWDVPEQKK